MKFIKLFEGYNEDIDAEKKRHKEAIDVIKNKYRDGIHYCLTNLIEDYGFERQPNQNCALFF